MTLPRESLSKIHQGLYHYNNEPTVITGRFTIGARPNFYETQQGGQGARILRNGVGDYQLTLTDTDVVDVYSATFTIQDDTGAHTDLTARAEDVTITAGVCVVECDVLAVAAPTDVLTANNLYCYYQIVYARGGTGQPDFREIGYYHYVTDAVMVCGGVDIGAVGAVGVHHGEGFTMTRAGAGDYLITFTEAFNGFGSGVVNAGNATGVGGDLTANFGAFTPGAAGACTLTLGTQAAAVATDPAAGGRINFCVYLDGEATGA